MERIKCKKPETLLLGGEILMMQTSGFRDTDVQPYLQVGSMMPNEQEKLNRSLHEREYWYGNMPHQHSSALHMPCNGNYARAFFFYPTENKHFELVNMLLAQAPAPTSLKVSKGSYMAVQTAIALEDDEEPVETLIVVHYVNT